VEERGRWWRNFLGKLETQGYLADQLQVAMPRPAGGDACRRTMAHGLPGPYLNGQNARSWRWGPACALAAVLRLYSPARGRGSRQSLRISSSLQLVWLANWKAGFDRDARDGIWLATGRDRREREWEETFSARRSRGEQVEVPCQHSCRIWRRRTARRATAADLSHARHCCWRIFRAAIISSSWTGCGCGLDGDGVCYAIGVAIYLPRPPSGLSDGARWSSRPLISAAVTERADAEERAAIVLANRQALKYASLDCWKLVSEQLPTGVSLQRFSFSDGHKLSLSGTTTPDQITPITISTIICASHNECQRCSTAPAVTYRATGEPIKSHGISAWNSGAPRRRP